MRDSPRWLQTVKIPMPATLGAVNLYLIRGPSGLALIDTGVNDATGREALLSTLARDGLALGDIETVVCTHHHVDHAGLGRMLQDAGAEVWMSSAERSLLLEFHDHPERDRDRAALFGGHGLPDELVSHVQNVFPFFRSLGERFEPRTITEHMHRIHLGGIAFELLELAGHTPGHIGLYQPDDKVVFTGDSVISKQATHMDAGQQPDDDIDGLGDYLDSLDRLTALGEIRGFPGHGSMIRNVKARALEIRSFLLHRMEQVRDVLSDTPKTTFALSGETTLPDVTRPARAIPRWLRMTQTAACLTHLVRRGLAVQIESPEGKRYFRAPPVSLHSEKGKSPALRPVGGDSDA